MEEDPTGEYIFAGCRINTDKALLDFEMIHGYLSRESCWAAGRQAGFARVITDHTTFGRLCDVFVLDAHEGKGLDKWLVKTVVSSPDLTSLRRMCLGTRDAHELYRKYGGFAPLAAAEQWMERMREKT